MKKKKREYEQICDCLAYKFPHRLFGGRCDGMVIIYETKADGSQCHDCHLYDDGECQVLEGLEYVKNAPCAQEHVRVYEIRPPSTWQGGKLRRFNHN